MKPLRCAIYTRKSTEEGLDQAFNSLHAQREACEAYVLSQAGEGWSALPDVYDDGGFSGGNMDRPALKRLLADIRAKCIDVVVVYKVDRLTRALNDFARIVEQFDASGVSFVSVTQAFNTTSSMGRLTLNVLLSFAQFEREVTGERIRDKIAASKKKGMWMGGALPLGYDPPTDLVTRALVVNDGEAELVRTIFAQYLEHGSVHRLVAWLGEQGATTKVSISKKGVARGGLPFNRGNLFHLLKNRTYLGDIPHKDVSYPGIHPAIIDQAIFDEVQRLLTGCAKVQRQRRAVGSGSSPLKGIIYDADGDRMSPVANKNASGRTYRYYVSSKVQCGLIQASEEDDLIRRVSASGLEKLISERVGRLCPGIALFPDGLLARVDVMPTSLALSLHLDRLPRYAADPDGALARLQRKLRADERITDRGDGVIRLIVSLRPQLRGGRTEFLSAAGQTSTAHVRRDAALIRALRTAHARLAALQADGATPPIGTEYDRRLLRLAFLAPDIQRTIMDGRQPVGLNLQRLRALDLPSSWDEQRSLLLA